MTKKNDASSAAVEWSFFVVILGFLVFFGVLVLIWLLLDILLPIFIAFLLALIFRPYVDWLYQRWRWPARLSLILLLLLLAAIITALSIYLLPLIFQQASQFFHNLPRYIEELMKLAAGKEIKLDENIRARIAEAADKPGQFLLFLFRGTAKSLTMLIAVLGMGGYLILFTLLLAIFFATFTLNMPKLENWYQQFLPVSKRGRIIEELEKIYNASRDFVKTRAIIAVILSAVFSIGWAIAGVPYWLLLGIITGILNIVPYAAILGLLAALLVNGLEAIGSGGLAYALLWPTVVYLIGQLLEAWFLTPYLQGEKLNISFVVILFAILAGGILAGLLGMLLAIPIAAAWQIVFSDVIKPRLLKWAKNN